MTNLYLIAHKVRGEPAFDVAERMVCPECDGHECAECDFLGWWWIIPTSGHRAYPFAYDTIDRLIGYEALEEIGFRDMPQDLQDHYLTRTSAPRLDITALFKSPTPSMPRIRRRI